jgi:hypothetical protein
MAIAASDSPTTHYWLGAVALGAVAVWALYKCFASVRRDRILADTPLVKIRSAAQGYVKVIGHAKPAGEAPTAAPLSARPCVWWSYEIEQKVTNSKNESHWESFESGTSVEPFVLADADGECLVGPVNAEITPTSRNTWYGDRPNPTCLPVHTQGLLGTDDYRYTERLLSVGDLLSVTGELRSTRPACSRVSTRITTAESTRPNGRRRAAQPRRSPRPLRSAPRSCVPASSVNRCTVNPSSSRPWILRISCYARK